MKIKKQKNKRIEKKERNIHARKVKVKERKICKKESKKLCVGVDIIMVLSLANTLSVQLWDLLTKNKQKVEYVKKCKERKYNSNKKNIERIKCKAYIRILIVLVLFGKHTNPYKMIYMIEYSFKLFCIYRVKVLNI